MKTISVDLMLRAPTNLVLTIERAYTHYGLKDGNEKEVFCKQELFGFFDLGRVQASSLFDASTHQF